MVFGCRMWQAGLPKVHHVWLYSSFRAGLDRSLICRVVSGDADKQKLI